jgi:hypothetical protein
VEGLLDRPDKYQKQKYNFSKIIFIKKNAHGDDA